MRRAAVDDPIGAAIAALVPFMLAVGLAYVIDPELRPILAPWPAPAMRDGPGEWVARAGPDDRLAIPGRRVAYWADPNAVYGRGAIGPVQAIVVHYTDERPILRLVKYGQSLDQERGGNAYGYHIYVDRQGRIVQGAPLSRRTNHVKPPGHAARKALGSDVASASSIGVTMVGGCVSDRPGALLLHCSREELTDAQRDAGVAAVRALMALYSVPASAVYGHGDLQSDRAAFEGRTIATLIRGAGVVSNSTQRSQ